MMFKNNIIFNELPDCLIGIGAFRRVTPEPHPGLAVGPVVYPGLRAGAKSPRSFLAVGFPLQSRLESGRGGSARLFNASDLNLEIDLKD